MFSLNKLFILYGCIFRIFLDVAYIIFVMPSYSYMGYTLQWNPIKYFESLALMLFSIFFTTGFIKRVSDTYMFIFVYTIIMPMTTLYGLDDRPRWVIYCVVGSYFLLKIFRNSVVNFPICIVKDGQKFVIITSGLIVLISLGFQLLAGGLKTLNFDLQQVYEFRSLASNVIDRGVFAYINPWATIVFNLIVLSYGLYRKKIIIVGLSIVVQVLFFGLSSKKAILFYPLLVFAIYYYLNKARSFVPIINALLFCLGGSLIVSLFSGNLFIGSLFIRRMFFSLAKNLNDYFVYFENHAHVYWSNSLTSRLFDYPYDMVPASLIGVFQNTGSYVNTSFIGNAYMHAGFVGILLYSAITGLLFGLVDLFSSRSGLPMWFAIAITIVPFFQLITASDLPTAILTKGIGVCLISLFFIRSNLVMQPSNIPKEYI